MRARLHELLQAEYLLQTESKGEMRCLFACLSLDGASGRNGDTPEGILYRNTVVYSSSIDGATSKRLKLCCTARHGTSREPRPGSGRRRGQSVPIQFICYTVNVNEFITNILLK